MYSLQEYFGAEGWYLAERFGQMRRGARLIDPILRKTDRFAEARGRRPRALVTGPGRNIKDRNAMAMVTRLAEKGFDVDICPNFRTPLILARVAVENDVHVICITGLADGRETLPGLTDALQSRDGRDILVAVTGENPAPDPGEDAFNEVTVLFDFTVADDSVNHMLDVLEQKGGASRTA